MKKSLYSAITWVLILALKIVLCFGAGGGAGGSHNNDNIQVSDLDNTKILRVDHPLHLECKIRKEKDQKLDVTWFKDNERIAMDNDHYTINLANMSLIILSSSMDDVGVYKCTAGSQSFEVTVIYLAYKKLPKSVTVLQGDKLSLLCDVEGDPVPVISWQKDNVDVEESVNVTHFHLETNEKGTPNATFVIESAIYDDRAEYLCLITSSSLQYNTTTFVRVKDMYDALWPFLGICAEVFILCLIIFIYEKKRAKNDFEESDTDQPAEGKNISEHNKDSVRQRK